MLLVVAALSSARAEQPADTAQRVVSLIRSGCDFIATDPHRSQEQIAKHLGRPLWRKTRKLQFVIDGLPGWKATVNAINTVKLELPTDVMLRVAELERFLGPAAELEGDYRARRADGDSAVPAAQDVLPADFQFARTGPTKNCFISVHTDGRSPRIGENRVLVISFND
jgi:hypothetical protein